MFSIKMSCSKLVSTRRLTVLSLPLQLDIPATAYNCKEQISNEDIIFLTDRARNTHRSGRISTVDLLILTNLYQLLLVERFFFHLSQN